MEGQQVVKAVRTKYFYGNRLKEIAPLVNLLYIIVGKPAKGDGNDNKVANISYSMR